MTPPGLFGLINSNRDFTSKDCWGKNQFNSSFPAALCNYLYSKKLCLNFIILDKSLKTIHKKLKTEELYDINPTAPNIFFAFETAYSDYQPLVIGTLPRVDLVIQNQNTGKHLSPIEIKLTALPDNSTCDLNEDKYGTELVIRPDTIVYLACSICTLFSKNKGYLNRILTKNISISNWSNQSEVLSQLINMTKNLDTIALKLIKEQKPLVLQPIWKTNGKSLKLANNCLDVFVWSNLAFIQLFIDVGRSELSKGSISRQIRTIIWLYKMILDFSITGQFNFSKIIDELSYNTKNDKAFAVNGKVTHPYMKSPELKKPRIKNNEIKKIILGGGQTLLSPERRFDSVIFSSPELF